MEIIAVDFTHVNECITALCLFFPWLVKLAIDSLIIYRCDWSSEPPEEKKKKVFIKPLKIIIFNLINLSNSAVIHTLAGVEQLQNRGWKPRSKLSSLFTRFIGDLSVGLCLFIRVVEQMFAEIGTWIRDF